MAPDEQPGPYGPHIYIYIQSDHHARASIPNAWCTPTTLRTLRSLLPKIPFLGLRDTRVRACHIGTLEAILPVSRPTSSP